MITRTTSVSLLLLVVVVSPRLRRDARYIAIRAFAVPEDTPLRVLSGRFVAHRPGTKFTCIALHVPLRELPTWDFEVLCLASAR